MERLSAEASSKRVPSGSWVRDSVEKLSEDELKDKAEEAMASTLEELKSFKLFKEPIMAAVDKDKIPSYDEMKI